MILQDHQGRSSSTLNDAMNISIFFPLPDEIDFQHVHYFPEGKCIREKCNANNI